MVRGGVLTVGTAPPESGRRAGRARRARRAGRAETAAGSALLAVSFLGAVVAMAHPAPNALDRWGFATFPREPRSALLIRISDFGSPPVLILAALAAGLVALRSDRVRALSCVLGPAIVAFSVEFVIKPIVGRHFEAVLTYPSGTVADLAAVATAWAIAVPRWLRWPVVVAGAGATAAMMVAVVGLRWHYPSDAVGGAVLGVAIVLFIDGALHLWLGNGRRRQS